MLKDITKYCIKPENTIKEAIKVIDNNKSGIALVTDKSGILLGTITDGDIRRSMLSKYSLNDTCRNIMSKNPVTIKVGASLEEQREKMKKYSIRNLPVIDKKGVVKDITDLRDLMSTEISNQVAIIMAGGEGKRLRPLTENIPKPMVKVAGKPILERIIENLASININQIYISVNYHANIIEEYFGDGNKYGVKINYLKEKKKLGTAGALSLIHESFSDPILVMNGDVVTKVNFNHFFDFHKQHRSIMSIAAIEYHINIPYGVLNLAEHYVLGIEEKPSRKFLCNAGIYIIDPILLRLIPSNAVYNMTDLLQNVISQGLPINAFPIHEYWLDVGRIDELKKARKDFSILKHQ